MTIRAWHADDDSAANLPIKGRDEARAICKPFADDPVLTAWTEKLLADLKAWQARRSRVANPL